MSAANGELHTTRVTIERLSLTLNGVSAEIAQAALVGLDEVLARRLNVRALDPARWQETQDLRLPALTAPRAVDAETLRGLIADGVCALLETAPAMTPLAPAAEVE